LLAREKLTDAILRLIVAPRADALPTEWLTARALPPTPSTIDLFQLRTERDQPEWHPRPKSGPWRNSSAAWRELKSRTPRLDVEGLQFDALGRLAEATRSSLAWWDGQVWSFPAAATGRLLGTAAAQFRGVLTQAGCSVQDGAEGFPLHAQAVVVLRSTFSGGAVLAHKYIGLDGTTLWQASANQAEPRRHLLALAQWRSQRAIILA
jgi:branched-subunit amino acid aminotransferase/4-amino-4-deoxychorismate lyase